MRGFRYLIVEDDTKSIHNPYFLANSLDSEFIVLTDDIYVLR